MNIQFLIEESINKLKRSDIASYKIDSEILMSKAINKNRTYVILNPEEKIDNKRKKIFEELIKERCRGKPIAYLLGKKEFWKYEFYLSENVLIPRPDTEVIIEQVLKITNQKSNLNILDIGTGSGCIILSILKEKPCFYGTGVDISKDCIEISKINALKMGLNNRVKFFKTDIDNFNHGKYDLIISNPPYIKKFDLKCLERDVYDYEPKLALNGGLDGLKYTKKLIVNSSKFIKKNGILVLEISFDQTEKVKKILRENGYYIKDVVRDLAKNYRCITSIKK